LEPGFPYDVLICLVAEKRCNDRRRMDHFSFW
jgi:hypothetical protein